jgi:AcrR family transcriptional regulator
MSPRPSASAKRRHDPRTLALTYPEVPRLNARRIDICLTAARIFIERGYDATSVNDVASALGMTKAGLYHYISSKESLLYEIVNYSMDALEAEVIAPVRGLRDPEERLGQILLRHALLATCHDGHVTQLTDELQALPPALRKKIERRKREYFDLVRNTLLELKSAGRLRDVDPTVATFSTLGMIIWLPQWFKPRARLSSEEVAGEVTRLALGGLLKPKTRGKRRGLRLLAQA